MGTWTNGCVQLLTELQDGLTATHAVRHALFFEGDTIGVRGSMRRTFLSVSLWLAVSTASSARDNIRPGLWEITTTSNLFALVPHIPPEQMQKMASLAKQYGLEMPQIQNGVATSKVCITQQMAEQEIPSYFHENQSGCTVKNATKAGNSYRMDLVCARPRLQGNGRAEGIFTSAESFSGRTEFDSVVQGNPVYASADSSGRWINTSCGTVKPLH